MNHPKRISNYQIRCYCCNGKANTTELHSTSVEAELEFIAMGWVWVKSTYDNKNDVRMSGAWKCPDCAKGDK